MVLWESKVGFNWNWERKEFFFVGLVKKAESEIEKVWVDAQEIKKSNGWW